MPYSDNAQLPEAVRNSLSDSDQSTWKTVFNSAYDGTCNGDDVCAAKVAWSQMKKNARYFGGWASAEVIDRQGDKVEMGAFEKTMDLFMHLGSSIIDQHSNRKVGQYINYEFKDKPCLDGAIQKGVWMEGVIYQGQRIHDDVWDKIQKGEYSGLSIGADPLETQKVCDAKTCWNAIKNIDLFEISVVEIPANQEALIEEVNPLVKSDNKNNIGDTMADTKPTIEKAADPGDGGPAVEPTLNKSDEILTMLKSLGDRMLTIEGQLQKEDTPPEEDEDEEKEDGEEDEEDMEEKSIAAPDIEGAVEKAVAKALEKRLLKKDADTPRPDLQKNELGPSINQNLLDPAKTAKMSIKEIENALDGESGRPW